MSRTRAASAVILLAFLVFFLQIAWKDQRLSALQAGDTLRYRISGRDWWSEALPDDTQGKDFALASIIANEKSAEVSLKIFEGQEELLSAYFREKEESALPVEDGKSPWIYMKMKLEDISGIDIWHWLQNQEDGYLYRVLTDEPEEGYYFLQNSEEAEKRQMLGGKRVLTVKDGFCFLLECGDVTQENEQEVCGLVRRFNYKILPQGRSCWTVGEEELYWTDHERRETVKQNPRREFVEVRAGADNSENRITGLYGLMTEAHYQVRLAETLPEMNISFYRQEKPEEEVTERLWTTTWPYRMEIRTVGDDRPVQEMEIDLDEDGMDTVSFEDIDGDGFMDMKAECLWRVECNYLWNPEKEMMVRVEKEELQKRKAQNTGEKKERPSDGGRKVKVQKGDSLWSISRRYYGEGRKYIFIYENNRQLIGNDPSFIPEGMELELP